MIFGEKLFEFFALVLTVVLLAFGVAFIIISMDELHGKSTERELDLIASAVSEAWSEGSSIMPGVSFSPSQVLIQIYGGRNEGLEDNVENVCLDLNHNGEINDWECGVTSCTTVLDYLKYTGNTFDDYSITCAEKYCLCVVTYDTSQNPLKLEEDDKGRKTFPFNPLSAFGDELEQDHLRNNYVTRVNSSLQPGDGYNADVSYRDLKKKAVLNCLNFLGINQDEVCPEEVIKDLTCEPIRARDSELRNVFLTTAGEDQDSILLWIYSPAGIKLDKKTLLSIEGAPKVKINLD